MHTIKIHRSDRRHHGRLGQISENQSNAKRSEESYESSEDYGDVMGKKNPKFFAFNSITNFFSVLIAVYASVRNA